MIEIIVMLGVMGWFWRTATSGGKNAAYGVMWVIIGGLSYFVPAKLFDFFIYPALVKPVVTADNYIGFIILGAILGIGIGAVFCVLARKVLLSQMEAARVAGAQVSGAMDKYYNLLASAIPKLENNTVEARRELYDRARRALQKKSCRPDARIEQIRRRSRN